MNLEPISDEPFGIGFVPPEPGRRLAQFVRSVADLVRISALSRFVLFSGGVRRAWLNAVQSVPEERIEGLLAELEGGGFDDHHLESVGLYGAELEAKLDAYAEARNAFAERGGISNFARALRWAKAILGSLTKVVPLADFILELVEFAENGARDVKDLEAGRL